MVILVAILAAIMPPLPSEAFDLNRVVAGVQNIGSVGEVIAPKRRTSSAPRVVSPSRQAIRSSATTSKKRIELDTDKMSFRGNGAYWLREHLAAMIRNRTRNTGKVAVAVTGRQFRDIAETQDRIHDSGRYSAQSRRQVPRGEMVAPTDQFRVTAVANVFRKNQSGSLPIGRNNVRIGSSKIVATVTITIEPVGIASGLSDFGFEATGEASKTNMDVSGSLLRRYGNYRTSSGNIDTELLELAASRAVDDFIARL